MSNITASWERDLDHPRIMQASLAQSPLAEFDYHNVVPHEEKPLIEAFHEPKGRTLHSTNDTLPECQHSRQSQVTDTSYYPGLLLLRTKKVA